MPPKGRQRLSSDQIDRLKRWIDSDLPWQPGFTFAQSSYEPPLEPRRPRLPTAQSGRTNPIDRILDAYLAEHESTREPGLSDAAFFRRLSLDVLGLLPPPDQLVAFLADEAADKRDRLVQEVLANNQAYAEHWLTFWNDLLRNAYSGTGYIDGGRKQITGWLYRSLCENKPYDDFVRELIAPQADAEGFVRGIKWRGNVNASQKRELQFAQNITQVFLGMNMKCASCHDSFIDRWTLSETYGLAAVYAVEPLEIHRCDKPTGALASPAWLFPQLGRIDPLAPRPARLRQLASLMVHPQNGRLTRTIVNRLWHRLMGYGVVHPVDAMHTEPWCADLLDYLAVHLSDHEFNLKRTIELIVTSNAYQTRAVVLDEAETTGAFVYRGPVAKRLTAEQFLDAIRTITQTWPDPDKRAFKRDGRQQGGQLTDVLQATSEDQIRARAVGGGESAWRTLWGERAVRASLAPLDPLQASLGRPNREQVVTMRPATLTTLEAIHLTNGDELAGILHEGATKLIEGRGEEPEALVPWVFQYALSRTPLAEERLVANELLGPTLSAESVADFLWAVFMLPEFQLVR